MIVQCDQCNAKFRLDDAKIKEGGAKVRCSKCKHIFVVKKDAPAEETDFDTFLSGLGETSPKTENEHATADLPPGDTSEKVIEEKIKFESSTAGEISGLFTPAPDGFDFGEIAFDGGTEGIQASKSAAVKGTPEDDDDLAKGEANAQTQMAASSEVGMSIFDEHAFSFADELAPPTHEEAAATGPGGRAQDKQEFSFTDESTQSSSGEEVFSEEVSSFGDREFSFEEEPVLPSPANESKIPAFAEEDFFLSQGSSSADTETGFVRQKGLSFEKTENDATPAPLPTTSGSKAPFEDVSAMDFSFEDLDSDRSLPPGKTDILPSKSQLSETEGADAFTHEPIGASSNPEMPVFEAEPTAPLPSRRRGVSALPYAVTAISVLLVLALAAVGFYFFKDGPAAFNKFGLGFMVGWFGQEVKEEGVIVVRNTVGTFLKNAEAGDILVINGEAVNNYAKARASIQIKAALNGPKGEILQQKTVYCGNVLSKEQLMTLPLAKIEAAMGNQFGDSLSNLSVSPGKGIPFVVVFANVPAGATEFDVAVAASTVASQ